MVEAGGSGMGEGISQHHRRAEVKLWEETYRTPAKAVIIVDPKYTTYARKSLTQLTI